MSCLVLKLNYHATKWVPENLLKIEINKTWVKINKVVYLGLSILDISKITMHEYWYDYVKPKYDDKRKLSWISTDPFIVHIKFEDVYAEVQLDFEKRFDTSNYDINRLIPIGKNKKNIFVIKHEFGGRIIKEMAALRSNMYSYLRDDGWAHKKAKGTKKWVMKHETKLDDYKKCQENNKKILKTQ